MATGQGAADPVKGSSHSLFDKMRRGRERLGSRSTSQDITLHTPKGEEISQLHTPKNSVAMKSFLKKAESIDVDAIDPKLQKAPIHSIVTGKSEDKQSILQTLLTYSTVDVNLADLDGMTPLHLAVKANDFDSVKLLIAFGANINALNFDGKTPTDVSISACKRYFFRNFKRQSSLKSWTGITVDEGDADYADFGFMVVSLPGSKETVVIEEFERPHASSSAPVKVPSKEIDPLSHSVENSLDSVFLQSASLQPRVLQQSTDENTHSLEEVHSEITQLLKSMDGTTSEKGLEVKSQLSLTSTEDSEYSHLKYKEGSATRILYRDLDDVLKQRNDQTKSISDIDDILCSSMQHRELIRYRKTGSRILCLDGGGMKGLAEIDVMENLEIITGKKITELFDWFVGTSIGGILALGLIYAKKSLKELRQLCFQLKDEVFGSPKFGMAYNTEALERLLKESLGTDLKMGDIKHPKVLVTATYKGTLPLHTHLFNNCFEMNKFSDVEVWKVARSTSAGPVLFSEFNNYVDGGVLCNNPTDQGVTAIQNYHWENGEKLPISLIVSIGSGVYPKEELGNVDAMDLTLFKMHSLKNRVGNLLDLFMNALIESESVAETCEHNFKEQGIPFYRFSPKLSETISAGETDSKKLLEMIIATRQQTSRRLREVACTHFCQWANSTS